MSAVPHTAHRIRLTATEARAAIRSAKGVILRVLVAPDQPERMMPVPKAHALELLRGLDGAAETFTVTDEEYLWLGYVP